MISTSVRALGRRHIAVMLAGLTAFGAFVAYRTQASADAHETTANLGMSCTLAGALTVNHTVTHTPVAGAVAGEVFTLSVKSAVTLPENLGGVAVTGMGLKIPIPAGVTSGGGVHVMGGSFTKASESVSGSTLSLDLAANAGTTIATMAIPELMIPMNIPANAAGQTIAFAGPSSLTMSVNVAGNALTETCTANAGNPPLVSTVVAAGSTPTTAGPTTSSPATTAAPTTAAPTTRTPTTAAPTTRTPTTAAPTTRGPVPTTTTAPGGGGDDDEIGEAGPPTAVSATPTYTG